MLAPARVVSLHIFDKSWQATRRSLSHLSRRPTASVISVSVLSPMHYRQAYMHLIREHPIYQQFTLASHLIPEPSRWQHECSAIDRRSLNDMLGFCEVIAFAIFTAEICILHVGGHRIILAVAVVLRHWCVDIYQARPRRFFSRLQLRRYIIATIL